MFHLFEIKVYFQLEADNQELKQKVQQISLHEQVSSEKAKVDREIEGERKQAL